MPSKYYISVYNIYILTLYNIIGCPTYGASLGINKMSDTETEEAPYSKVIGCMYHLPLTEFDYLEETLKKYDIGWYIIGHETDPYDHFHVAFEELSEKQYTNFNKKVVEDYGLRADCKKGTRKQYGKITKIKDIDRLKSYTVKDGNYRSNLPPDELQVVIENSFRKSKRKEWLEECIQYVETLPAIFSYKTHNYPNGHWKHTDIDELIGKELIKYHIEKGVRFTFNAIKSMIRYSIQETKHLDLNEKANILWSIK